MKKSVLIGAALLAVFGSSAFAQGGGGRGANNWPPAALQTDAKPVTRAQVKAELVKAEQDGTLARDNRVDYPATHVSTDSTKTRAEVKAEIATPTSPEVQALYRGN